MSKSGVMSTGNIVLEKKDRTAWITLERPPVNVLDLSLLGELGRVLDLLAGDDKIDFVVLRGSGGRAFSAGVDVKDHTREKAPEMLEVVHGVVRRLFTISKITIAEIKGACLGGALELVSSCDLVLATEDAGVTWVSQSTPISSTLRWVHVMDSGKVYAVGDDGTILRFR